MGLLPQLALSHPVTGTGVLLASANATLSLTGGFALGAVSGAGKLALANGAYTLSKPVTGIASIAIAAGASLSGSATVQAPSPIAGR